jgi:hypothetical protein
VVRRRLTSIIAGTAATGPDAVEVTASLDVEVDGTTTRVRVAPAGSPERASVSEVADPAVARWASGVHAELERTARREAYRNRPITPLWKPVRKQPPAPESMVCPDCDGAGCTICGDQGWRVR